MITIRTVALIAAGTAFSAVASAQVVPPKKPSVTSPSGAPSDQDPPMSHFKDDPIRRQVLQMMEPRLEAEREARNELDRVLGSASRGIMRVPPKGDYICTGDGCRVDVFYDNVDDFRAVDKRLKAPASPPSAWRGGVGRTGLLRTDTAGRFMATWFVLYLNNAQDQRPTSPRTRGGQ
jgi:hypothetical protein